MKKIIGVLIGIALVLLAMAFITHVDESRLVDRLKAMTDTRFWKENDEIYSEFHSGIYSCDIDIAPGNYDVEIQGGTTHLSSYRIYKTAVDENGKSINETIQSADLIPPTMGFHFSIKEGESIAVKVVSDGRMRIKSSKIE